MSKAVKKALLKYGITAAVGLAMLALVLTSYGYAEAVSTRQKMLILANAFTVPGTIIFMVGVLVWISNAGGMLGLTYVLGYTLRRLLPGAGVKQETYYDYMERKKEQAKLRGFGFLLHVGLAFLIPAVVFTVLFYQY